MKRMNEQKVFEELWVEKNVWWDQLGDAIFGPASEKTSEGPKILKKNSSKKWNLLSSGGVSQELEAVRL